MEYVTTYPRTISSFDGLKEKIHVDKKNGVEYLQLVVKESLENIMKVFADEGFTKVKFEHKKPSQIGHGLSLKLKKPWELHLRLTEMKKGLIAIYGEVEVSRDYLQHLFSQNTPVIYEIESILKKYEIDYRVWNKRINKYVHVIFDNYKIKLSTPNLPVFAWKPMLFVIGTVACMYLWKYLNTI
tara:strand:- start:30 stop:581 length:552 start_codon:yes stop_codon:yes gene_type:complete